MRHWTLDEANAALPRVREVLERIKALGDVPPVATNGQSSKRKQLEQLLQELNDDGIILRDPDRGLVDFPALAPSGRTYLLCWLPDEDEIAWWHWPDAGFAGRTPLTQPPE